MSAASGGAPAQPLSLEAPAGQPESAAETVDSGAEPAAQASGAAVEAAKPAVEASEPLEWKVEASGRSELLQVREGGKILVADAEAEALLDPSGLVGSASGPAAASSTAERPTAALLVDEPGADLSRPPAEEVWVRVDPPPVERLAHHNPWQPAAMCWSRDKSKLVASELAASDNVALEPAASGSLDTLSLALER
eukprot:1968292-Rhodomonas_salina.1